ncbi:MAG: enoyl-CoA hydratase/isomerase family protein [Acidobacteria bacterium]|nr:enoyl-CoA hydratase/isomerase family protein [Acidobacteriota bacterium]
MADTHLVIVERHGAVAVVTLNRPEKRNALSIALRRRLASQLRSLAGDRAVAAVVLTGAPPAFCAGMDRTEFGGDRPHRRALLDSSRELYASLNELPVPAIAAVNGPALGGGFALAACCDVRLASPTATFGHPEVALRIPASYGALLRVLPDQAARELAYTGRILRADEALRLGIVRQVAEEVVGHALALAAEMAAHGRAVVEDTKRLVIAAAASGGAARAWEAELEMFRRALFPDG